MFHVLSEEEFHFTIDLFWTEIFDFDKNDSSFDGDEFIWKIKDIRYGNIHLWHHKYSHPCTYILGSVAYIVTSKVLGIRSSDSSSVDAKTINSGKRSDIRNEVSYK